MNKSFAGSIPDLYEQYMVPLIFEPYAEDMAARVLTYRPKRVLEIAAGTGVLARKLVSDSRFEAEIIATDVSEQMLAVAAKKAAARLVIWQPADAHELPFADGAFDLVVCQFGVMFFADKVKAFSEIYRVLETNGTLLFNVWDKAENNEFVDTVQQTMNSLFPENPPVFLTSTPHGYYDESRIAKDLLQAGFTNSPSFDYVQKISRSESAAAAATAYCEATPLRLDLDSRGADALNKGKEALTRAFESRFGTGSIAGKIGAKIGVVKR